MWRNKVAVSTILYMIVVALDYGLADKELNSAVKQALERNGATVNNKGMVGFVNCLGSDKEVCDNFSNIDVMYSGLLFPCKAGGCNQANGPVLNRWGSFVQLDKNEAVVVFSYMPSKDAVYSYFGIQQMAYERDESQLDLDGYIPPQPGEVIPDPTSSGRYVIDAAMGDSFNQLTLNTARDPNDDSKEIFAIILTGNKIVVEEVTKAMEVAGFPLSAVNVASVTKNFLLDSTNTADSFRLVGRFAFDIGNEPKMEEWINSNPFELWRVSLDETKNFLGFANWIPEKKNRETGSQEIDHATNAADLASIISEVKLRFGAPDAEMKGTPRYYDDENCIDSGTYCWGNNDDTLYSDAFNEDGSLYVFNLANRNARVVIVALDHVKTNYATFWNYGFFKTSGVSLGSISHLNYNGFVSGNAFFVEISSDCADEQKGQRESCFEVPFDQDTSEEQMVIHIMNRNYLNPQTGTGQSANELQHPLFFVYEGKK